MLQKTQTATQTKRTQLRADQLSDRSREGYTLTKKQLQALSNSILYLDLHTEQNRAGEQRSILKAY